MIKCHLKTNTPHDSIMQALTLQHMIMPRCTMCTCCHVSASHQHAFKILKTLIKSKLIKKNNS